jgi:hypothetical protein
MTCASALQWLTGNFALCSRAYAEIETFCDHITQEQETAARLTTTLHPNFSLEHFLEEL